MLPTFRSLIRGRLQTLGWNQIDLAQRLNVTPETVSRIVNGKHAVPVDAADQWADALGFTVGHERERFLDVLHLSAAGERVRGLYERELSARLSAENFKTECQHRIRRARKILDLMDPDGKLAELAEDQPDEARRVAEADDADAADEEAGDGPA